MRVSLPTLAIADPGPGGYDLSRVCEYVKTKWKTGARLPAGLVQLNVEMLQEHGLYELLRASGNAGQVIRRGHWRRTCADGALPDSGR